MKSRRHQHATCSQQSEQQSQQTESTRTREASACLFTPICCKVQLHFLLGRSVGEQMAVHSCLRRHAQRIDVQRQSLAAACLAAVISTAGEGSSHTCCMNALHGGSEREGLKRRTAQSERTSQVQQEGWVERGATAGRAEENAAAAIACHSPKGHPVAAGCLVRSMLPCSRDYSQHARHACFDRNDRQLLRYWRPSCSWQCAVASIFLLKSID